MFGLKKIKDKPKKNLSSFRFEIKLTNVKKKKIQDIDRYKYLRYCPFQSIILYCDKEYECSLGV